MITIVNYGLGNLGSIRNMLKKLGCNSVITDSPSEVLMADKLILPGVGSFDTGMIKLRELGLDTALDQKVQVEKCPVLGICLGMQMFGTESDEGVEKGLNWIEGKIQKFNFQAEQKLTIPHMGWQETAIVNDSYISKDLIDPRFYYVHSYHFVPADRDNEILRANYGYDFTAGIQKENVIGVQFHPEKSHKYGMQLLENYINF